jgi:hypothetical protein
LNPPWEAGGASHARQVGEGKNSVPCGVLICLKGAVDLERK